MQRSLPIHRSVMLICLGLSAGFGVQAVLLSGRSPGLADGSTEGPADASPPANLVQSMDSAAVKPFSNRLSPPPPMISVIMPRGRVVVDLSDRKVYLYEVHADAEEELKAEYLVAIGQAEWETPVGRYHIGEMQIDPAWEHPLTGRVVPPGPENPLGAAWIGFLSREDYSFGIHGTLNETLIGQAVSHGCIRMRNADVLELYGRVEKGWPLEVRR